MQYVLPIIILITCGEVIGQRAREDDYVKDVVSDALHFINACGQNDLLVCLKVGKNKPYETLLAKVIDDNYIHHLLHRKTTALSLYTLKTLQHINACKCRQ